MSYSNPDELDSNFRAFSQTHIENDDKHGLGKVGRLEEFVFVSYRALQDTYVTPNQTDITVCLRYVRIPVDP